jgi:hypothetical protein
MSLPPRLLAKVGDVQAAKTFSNAHLHPYADAAVARLSNPTTDARSVGDLDIAHLPALVEMENSRHAGLNLHAFKHYGEFVEALGTPGPASFRAVFPTQRPDHDPGFHHVMADVRRHPDGPPTVVLTESGIVFAGQFQQEIPQINHLANQLEAVGISPNRVAVVETSAQKSQGDCIMFSLSYALKAFKNPDALDRLHDTLKRSPKPNPADPSRRSTTAGQIESDYQLQLVNTHMANGVDAFPVDFFKHTHSSGLAKSLMSRPGGEMSGPVNSAGTENLAERNQAFRVTRQDDKGKDIRASASIDGFRLQEVRRLLNAQS